MHVYLKSSGLIRSRLAMALLIPSPTICRLMHASRVDPMWRRRTGTSSCGELGIPSFNPQQLTMMCGISAVLVTSADVLLILALGNPLKGRPVRMFEIIIAVLVSSSTFVIGAINNRLINRCLQCLSAWQSL